jgi:hypothetical protein
MKTLRMLGMNFLMPVLLSSAMDLLAQTPGKPALAFVLAIEEQKLNPSYPATEHELLVRYTNVSEVVQNDGCVVSTVAYKMVILRDGVPAEKRKAPNKETEEPPDPNRIKVRSTEADRCHGITGGINPGQSVTFTLWPSSKYDMTAPGTYEITVTREVYPDPWSPRNSFTVRSNTLTIVVPMPGAAAPPQ